MFFADAFDEGGDLCEAAVIRFVGVIIDRVDVAVEICGSENRYLNSIGCEASADENKREHDDECCQEIKERFSVSHVHNEILNHKDTKAQNYFCVLVSLWLLMDSNSQPNNPKVEL